MYSTDNHPTSTILMDGGFTRPMEQGRALFWEGDEACSVYRLDSGFVRAVLYDEAGNRKVIAFFKPGDIFGVPIEPTYRYTAEAITAVRYKTFSAHHWDPEENGNTAHFALRDAIRAELKAAHDRVILLSQQGSLERMASFLTSFSKDDIGNALPITIPQLDIASYLGLTPETVCRTVKKLKDQGLIEMPRRDTFIVMNPIALKQILEAH